MGLNLHNKNLDFLFKAVLALENVEECYDFFEDLCTVHSECPNSSCTSFGAAPFARRLLV